MVSQRLPAQGQAEARQLVPRLMGELRARAIAAVSPLTYIQVQNMAYFAALQDGRPEFELWLNWSASAEEVGEWLWQYWQENAIDPDEGGPEFDLLRRLNYRPAVGSRPAISGAATVRSAEEKRTKATPCPGSSSW